MKNLLKLKVTNLLIPLLLISCQKEISTHEFSRPKSPKKINLSLDKNTKRIVIATTNNFNSAVSGVTDSTLAQSPMALGGADFLPTYLNILRKEYKNEVLLLDAGYLVNKKKNPVANKKTLKLFEMLGYDAVLLTENELLNLKESYGTTVPFVNSNIIELKKLEVTDHFGSRPFIIKEVNGVKVGIVGITSYKPELKGESEIAGLLFDDPVARLITMKRILKEKTDIIIALVHMETHCSSQESKNLKECPDNKEAFRKLIKRFPPNLVDIIIGGDSNYAAGFIEGIPVLQNYGHGKFLGQLDIYYDLNKKEIIKEHTKIHKPTKLCSRFFMVSQDCHIEADDVTKIKRVKDSRYQTDTAKFLGKTITPDLDIVKYLNATELKTN
ncbi:lipoprotein [Bacteriovorax sp. DB6_IX]|uniref:lipoprotein n=1 Tax=Bacteriovorax sp. DB6_IX TaxID=1353530 RepID=UPI00038A0514|nr:lipoprotein [Bacteriovorax sp. DB6_IX]EQC47959.1 putative lipoprotein [Bacteriovorax sp. DB6_IX]